MAYDSNIRRLPDPYYNNGVGFVSASVRGVSTGTSHPLNGGGVVSAKFSGAYWEIDISYPSTIQAELDTVLPFLESVEGVFNSFYVMLPQYRYPKTGAWDVSTAALRAEGAITLVNDKTISISSWSTRGGDLSVGDMIKFTNTAKIYKITAKSYDSGSDTVTFELNTSIKFPSLLSVAGLEPNELMFKVRMKDNKTPSPALQPNGIYSGFSISLRENPVDE